MRRRLKILINFLSYTLEHILWILPRKKDKWLFGSMGSFMDNPKYLFLSTLENHPEINAIWISHQKKDLPHLKELGLKSYYWLSLKGIYHALTAKVFIGDHHVGNINQLLSGGAFFFNLWHGSSVKRVRWQAPEYIVKKYHLKDKSQMRTSFRFKIEMWPILFRKADLLLTPSSIQKREFFAPMMDVTEEKCIVGVYPRSKLLIEGKESAMSFISKYEPVETKRFVESLGMYSKVYVYMPTWRNDSRDFISQAEIDWSLLNRVLSERNELFILKFHPSTKISLTSIDQYSNIRIYPPVSDIYTVLPFIDCLITDYSSIYTDFLMMNKEIILFVFDYEEYVKGGYELAEYDKYFVGKRAYSFTQLLSIMKSGEDCHVPQEKYKFLMDFFWDSNKERIDLVEEVKKRIVS